MPTYNKLVRDKIPDIIEKSGRTCRITKLDNVAYVKELKMKLTEEVSEYLQSTNDVNAVEELADVLEIIRSLATVHGKNFAEIDVVRKNKYQECGGFANRLFLIEVEENNG